jgi:hypothetical protein
MEDLRAPRRPHSITRFRRVLGRLGAAKSGQPEVHLDSKAIEGLGMHIATDQETQMLARQGHPTARPLPVAALAGAEPQRVVPDQPFAHDSPVPHIEA